MRFWSSLGGLGLGVALLLCAGRAAADEPPPGQDEGYAVQFAQRPLTLTNKTLELYGSTDVTRLVKSQSMLVRDLETQINVDAGAAFGITRNLEVRAALATLQIRPKLDYGNPTVGLTYRFLNSGLESGARLSMTLVTKPDTLLAIDQIGAVLEPSVPFLLHLGKSARLDFSVGLPVTIQKGKPTMVGINAPVAFAFNLVDALHIGLRTSVLVNDFKSASRYLTVPLGVFAGISLGTEKPFIEVDPFFTWPQFAQPGATGPTAQKVNIDVYTAGVSVRFFLFL